MSYIDFPEVRYLIRTKGRKGLSLANFYVKALSILHR